MSAIVQFLERSFGDIARGFDDGINWALDNPFVLWLVVFAVVLVITQA